MSISAEVFDCTYGNAAEGVPVTLLHEVDAQWSRRAGGRTDRLGQVTLLPQSPPRGRYRLVVDLDPYYLPLGAEPAVSRAEMIFRVFRAGEQVRVKVLITPASYYVVRSGAGG